MRPLGCRSPSRRPSRLRTECKKLGRGKFPTGGKVRNAAARAKKAAKLADRRTAKRCKLEKNSGAEEKREHEEEEE